MEENSATVQVPLVVASRVLHVRNLHPEVTDKEVWMLGTPFGQVPTCTCTCTVHVHVHFTYMFIIISVHIYGFPNRTCQHVYMYMCTCT